MARNFTKNLSNTLQLGVGASTVLINGAAGTTFHCWAKASSIDAADGNDLFGAAIDGSLAGVAITIDGSASNVLRIGGRSSLSDSFQSKNGTTGFGTGTWRSCGGVYNYAAATIQPYFNGVAEGGGSVTFGASTFTRGSPGSTDGIGSNAGATSTTRQFAGDIAELGLWKAALTAAEMAVLATGASPLFVRPASLEMYFPLIGRLSPEKDIVGGLSATITGTIANANHPRIIMPRGRKQKYQTAAVPAPPLRAQIWM